jgi:putative ABC transport system permease protein
METLRQNIRFGLRMLVKSPAYTFVAIIALALGIGANTAIFSVVYAVLLKPLPYLDSERLVAVESGNEQRGVEQFGGLSPADFWDLKEQSQTFEQLAGFSSDGGVGVSDDPPELLRGPRVSTNFFDLLYARPLLGRTFNTEDGLMKSADTVVLSYSAWQRRFGGDPNVIGRVLDGPVQVIGVMPPDFRFPESAECWIPLSRDSGEARLRRERYMNVLGLIKPGQTVAGAQAELKTIAARLAAQYPESNKNITVAVTPMRDRMVRDVKTSLLLMFGAVGFVLLIACANVANLLLARAAARRREMAVRAALGATRRNLIAQLLTESVMLAVAGGALGLLLALWGRDGLIGLLPESYAYLRLRDQVRIDGVVTTFTTLIAVLTGIVFGLIPAWQASKPAVNEFLKEGGRGSDGLSHQRLRGALVVAEIALAMVLLVGAGLLIGSFARLRKVELGFDPNNLFSTSVSVPFSKYRDEASRVEFVKQMQQQVAAAPGVESVAVTSGLVFPFLRFPFNLESKPLPADESVLFDLVSPNYFSVVKARMIAGREFDDRDNASAPAVAVINEKLARQYFAGEDPVSKIVSVAFLGNRQKRQIVGVVRDLNQGDPARILPQIYAPYTQQTWFAHALVVRSTTNPEIAKRDVHRAIAALDPKFIPPRINTPQDVLGRALAEPKLYTTLLGAFAALALILAAVGIYGVMAYAVAQRTHEIGIRLALGAQAGGVLKLVVGQGMMLALTGVGIGLIASFALTRLMKGLLYGVSATDPLTFIVISSLLASVALLACWIPARRAMKVDPMIALRYE